MITKIVPVLGTIVLIGAIIQVAFGLEITWMSLDSLQGVHALIGIMGLILVLGLMVIAIRAKAPNAIKITMLILVVLVLIQVGLGMQLLGGADEFGPPHEANGILIVILSLLTGGLTMMNARRQKAV